MAANVSAAQYLQSSDALDRLVASLKAKMGVFLENSQTIMNLKDRAVSLAGASTGSVQSAAKALAAKGTALLNAQAATEKTAQDLLGAAAAVKDSVQSPTYSFLSTNPLMWGTRQFQILGSLISTTTSLASKGTALAVTIQNQNNDVKRYASEVRDVEGAASGTGVIPKITTAIQGTVSAVTSPLTSLLWPAAIVAAVGAGVYFGVFDRLLGRKS